MNVLRKYGKVLEEVKTLKILLTEEEQKEIEIFSEKIDLENTLKIVQYGVLAQKKAADLSDEILEIVQNGEKDLKKKLVEKIKQLEEKLSKEEFIQDRESFLSKSKKQLSEQKVRLEKLSIELDRISEELQLLQNDLIKEFLRLEKFSGKNQSCCKELMMYILAGKRKIEKVQDQQCGQLEKRLQDLELSKLICTQMEGQLILLQENYQKFSEEIQCEVDQTVPLLKNRMALLLEKID